MKINKMSLGFTYSNTYFGEHTTSVDGNGITFQKKKCLEIMSEIKDKVNEDLKEYL